MNALSTNRLLTSAIAAFGLLVGTTYAGGHHGGSHTASTPHRTSYLPPRSHTHHRAPTLPSLVRSIPHVPTVRHISSPVRNVGVYPTFAPQATRSVAAPVVQVQRNPLPAYGSSTNAGDPDRLKTHVQRNPASTPVTGLADFAPTTFGAPPVEPTASTERFHQMAPQHNHTQLAQAPAPSPGPSSTPMSDASAGGNQPHRPTLEELSVQLSDEEIAVVLQVLTRAQQIQDRRQAQSVSTPAAVTTTAPALPTGRLATYDTQEEALEAAGRFGSGAQIQSYDTGLTKNGRPILRYDVVR